MKKEIKITSSEDMVFWANFVSQNRYSADISKLVVDFSRCNFIDPTYLVSLSCLLEEYYQKDVEICFLKSRNPKVNNYLSNILFWDYWNRDFDRTEYHQNSKTTNLCLWKLNASMISNYVVYAQKYFEDNFGSQRSFEPLYISLAELFNNIVDHSKSNVSGYTTNQFYPQLKELRIAVCDFGIGIPCKINEYLASTGNQTISSHGALQKAFEKGFSTKTLPHNRGFGLDTLKTIIQSCGGNLKVISNNVILVLNSDGKIKISDLNYHFHGTHFEVILNTDLFDEKDDELLDDFSF